MQVECHECGKIGLLQTITPRYHRVRHTIKKPYFSSDARKICYNRQFTYCRVHTQWAEELINAEKKREEAEYKRIMGIK